MKKMLNYFSPQESHSYFDKLRTDFLIKLCMWAFLIVMVSISVDLIGRGGNFIISLISKVLMVVVFVITLFLLKNKGVDIAGNFFSLTTVILLVIFLNIVSPKVDVTYKYLQGFYSGFVFVLFGLLYASRNIIWINLGLILITVVNVLIQGVHYFPEKKDLLINGAIHYLIVIIASIIVILYIKKFIRLAIKKAEDELDQKELKNQELITSEEEIRAANEELVATTDALVESNEALRLAKEKAEESAVLKTEFLNNMSHEVRTPMNAIIGFSDLLDSPGIDIETQKRFVSTIQDSSNQLLIIIESIVDISRLASNIVEVVESPNSFNSKFKEIYCKYQVKVEGKGIELDMALGQDSEDKSYYIDELKIEKILNNLLDNSVKFTEQGKIEYGYTITDDNDSEVMFQIFVKDTGIGIPEDKIDIVFDRFSQAESSLSRKYGGLGLGLSIVQEIVKLLKGSIELKSERRNGTEIYVNIPVKKVL